MARPQRRSERRIHRSAVQQRAAHAYVTHLTEEGVDRRFIQVQADHENDSSTAIYTHVGDDFMDTALRRALAPAREPGHGGRPGRE
jgi:integrase/recombinase XerC